MVSLCPSPLIGHKFASCKFSKGRNSRIRSIVGVSNARDDLLELIADDERGLKSQKDLNKKQKITRVIDTLAELAEGSITTDSRLSGTWKMLWTTEKEQLFIVDKAHWFGSVAGDILQVIDVERSKLNNVITFPPSGAFLVSSSIQIESIQRVNFRFSRAILRGAKWSIPIPPFGKGWFESVYMDDQIRLAKDIRGDYLVVERCPYTWAIE